MLLVVVSYMPIKVAKQIDQDLVSYWLKHKDRAKSDGASSLNLCKYARKIDANWMVVGDTHGLFQTQKEPPQGVEYIFSNTKVEDNPLFQLNSNFDPQQADNVYILLLRTWENALQKNVISGTRRLYHEEISYWNIAYPIQRKGRLASALLPKGWLTIWDFIGPSALAE